MQLNSRIFLAFSILVLLFIINPIVASLGFGLFSFFYLFIFSIVRKIVFRNGHIVSSKFAERYKTMLEGFGGIKDLLILRRQQFFYERFESSGNELSQKIGTNKALETSPRYLVEFLAFSAVIVLILYLSSVYSNELSRMLPIISIYAVAALKLLPALQGIYGGLTSISGNMAAFYSIKNDLYLAAKENPPVINLKNNIKLKSEITFNNISYRYPHQSDYVLKNFSLSFPANKLIGIVGPTGSGKSTIVDLVLGLLVPESGSILIDNQKINSSNIHAWQKKVGYVPQSSFLADLSIAENIAFGIKPELIDMQRVSKCAQISMIHDYIFNLPDKYDSMIGEKGVQMSGGQRQRISIARALYNDPEFLVLDEATSALDGITEKQLMESIIALSKNKTILMIAHKLNTVKNCDKVLFLQDGILSDQGTYDEMLEQNSEFKNFVNAVWKIK
jgi:HlyD family secretion protein